MGQKSNPNGLRIGITIKSWESQWFANSKVAPQFIYEDFMIRDFINYNLSKASISKVEIERIKRNDKYMIKINLYILDYAMIFSKDRELHSKLVKKLEKLTQKEVTLNVLEIKNADKIAILVAKTMAKQLEQRFYFRRVQKMAIQKVLKAGVKGVKTLISGRLGGLEMARSEGYLEGNVPLNTFRSDVEYAFAEAKTTYGTFGVKVWIFHGNVLPGETILDTRKPSLTTKKTVNFKKKNYSQRGR